MDFFDPAHEMPTLIFFDLFHHDRGWENESILGRIGGYINNLGSKVITSRNIYKQIIYLKLTDCRFNE